MKSTLTLICSLLLCVGLSAQSDMMILKSSGKVVIGDTSLISTPGTYNLYVQNGILTERVKVSLRNTVEWSDDAWDQTPSLAAVAQSIIDKRHLVDMPSAESLVQTGYDVTTMDASLLQQIEWLWQHSIRLQDQNDDLRQRIEALESK